MLPGCTRTKSVGPMLTGKLCECDDMTLPVEYFESGCKYCDNIHIGNDGSFSFEPGIKGNSSNVRIIRNDDVIGAYIEKGKLTVLTEDNENICFEGDNIDKNVFFYVYEKSFNNNIFKCDTCNVRSSEEMNLLLDRMTNAVKRALAGISDNTMREKLFVCVEQTHIRYADAIRVLAEEGDASHFNSILDSITPGYVDSFESLGLDGYLTKSGLN